MGRGVLLLGIQVSGLWRALSSRGMAQGSRPVSGWPCFLVRLPKYRVQTEHVVVSRFHCALKKRGENYMNRSPSMRDFSCETRGRAIQAGHHRTCGRCGKHWPMSSACTCLHGPCTSSRVRSQSAMTHSTRKSGEPLSRAARPRGRGHRESQKQ